MLRCWTFLWMPLLLRQLQAHHSQVKVDNIENVGRNEPDPFERQYTKPRCMRMAAWADVCVYDNVCWNGEFWIFFDKYASRDPLRAGTIISTDDMVLQTQSAFLSAQCRVCPDSTLLLC